MDRRADRQVDSYIPPKTLFAGVLKKRHQTFLYYKTVKDKANYLPTISHVGAVLSQYPSV